MKFIDTHAHLDFPQFKADRDKIISDLSQEEIGVISISTSVESVADVISLASGNALVWGLLGIHPVDLRSDVLVGLPKLLESWRLIFQTNPKIIGIGEVGLDYYHENLPESANRQKAALRQFLTFAEENNLPLSIHCRDAYGDLLTILADYPKVRCVIHCYNGSQDQAKLFLELGHLLSFTAMITYPQNEALRIVVKDTPLNKIMLETDSPFLPLQNKRGQRNDPRVLPELASFVANIKGVTVEEVALATTKNATDFFNLGEV